MRAVVSAGSINSPQLLELSGIGRPELLKKYGIEVRHELAAVGENFRDHINARIIWKVKDPRVSYNHMARGLGAVTQMMKYMTTGGGFMSLPSAPLLAFLKTRPELATPDVQMHLVPYAIKDPKTRKLQDFPSMTIACYQLRPESLGSIHIKSPDPKAQPAIRFNFLADPIDQRAMVEQTDTLVDSLHDPEKGGQADYAFHLAIVRSSGSSALMKIYEAISPLLMRSHVERRRDTFREPAITSHLVDAHRAVFLSLVQRDPDAAESRLRQHFRIGDEIRRKNLFTNYQNQASN